MAIGNLYVHSADGRVEAYWTGGAGTGTLEYSLDSAGLSGWTVASSSITGTNNHYAHTLANSTTARWWRYSEGGAPITFADAAYANSGLFQDADGNDVIPLGVGNVCHFIAAAGSTPAGSNANDGLGVATPKLTFAGVGGGFAAGDHTLYKRGDTFAIGANYMTCAAGVSATRLSMIGAYGPKSVARPIITSDQIYMVNFDFTNDRGYIAIQGIESTFSTHATVNSQTHIYFLGNATVRDSIVLSDLYLHEGTDGFAMACSGVGYYTNVSVRRCVIKDTYPNSNGNNCNGFLIGQALSPLIEDCYFINCGFLSTDRVTYPSTIFNHNLYCSEYVSDATIRNIVSVGGDVQTRGGGLFERMMMINAPIGYNMAGRIHWGGSAVSEDGLWQDILLEGSSDIDGGLGRGYGIWATEGANGQFGSTATLTSKRVLINLSSAAGGLTTGTDKIPIRSDHDGPSPAHAVTHVFDGCVLPSCQPNYASNGAIYVGVYPGTLKVVDCVFDMAGGRPIITIDGTEPTTLQFGGNTYYSSRADTDTFGQGFFINNAVTGRSVASWATHVSDPVSPYSASTKSGSAIAFSDPRRLPDYLTHIGLGTATVDGYIAAIVSTQRAGTWDVNLTAEYAIDWIRQGYGMPALLGPAAPTIDSTSSTSTTITVNWTDNSASAVSGEYRLDGGTATAMPNVSGSFSISGLTPSTSYGIEIRVNDGVANSAWSGVTTQATAAAPTRPRYSPTAPIAVLGLSARLTKKRNRR